MDIIVDFDNYKHNLNKDDCFNLTEEDIFNLFLIFKSKDGILTGFDINVLMMSLAKHSNLEKFVPIFKNIWVEKNVNGVDIINLNVFLEKKAKEKLICINPKNNNQIYILGYEQDFERLSSNYDKSVLELFNNLMFYINNDLEFGINNWEILFADEIIKVDGYPSFITGEFIDKDKNNPLVKKKMKKRTIEYLKK